MLYIHRGDDGERDPETGRKLKRYGVYCRQDGKLRTIEGNLATWTGNTPKWCHKRQELEADKNG